MWKCFSVTGAMKKVGVLLEALCGVKVWSAIHYGVINCLSLFSTCITRIFTLFSFAFALTSARNELTPYSPHGNPFIPYSSSEMTLIS